MSRFIEFWRHMIDYGFSGGKRYRSWLLLLGILMVPGLIAYVIQWNKGFIVTNLKNQVPWGAYIANFTFLVGVADAAILLVVPAYIFKDKDAERVVIFGLQLATAAILMCLLFIVVDLGHPERFLHILPIVGRLNFPKSILAWDVVVLNGYLLLNLHIPGYLLYKKWKREEPEKKYYLPLIFFSVVWAVIVHTVTAFLFTGIVGRPFWNAAILAPRFLISAFAGGAAILILVLHAVEHFGGFKVERRLTELMRVIAVIGMSVNMFLLGAELYKEFYIEGQHSMSAHYLFFGYEHYHKLVPYIWTAIALNTFALIVLASRRFRDRAPWMHSACAAAIVGIWIEKGMGLIVPGFVPTGLGEFVEYSPSLVETCVCLGIWAFGAFLFTVMAKINIGIQTGTLRRKAT